MRKFGLLIIGVWISLSIQAQHTISVEASLNAVDHTLDITQEIKFVNASEVILNELYLNDWANSFSSKTTPLAKRFSENFKIGFHFEKDELRGKTTVHAISTENDSPITWERTPELDIIKLSVTSPLHPGETRIIKLSYTVKIAEDKFTRFGVDREGNYKLKYWLITPVVFDGSWRNYSNKNTDDYFQAPTDYNIQLDFPSNFSLFSDLEVVSEVKERTTSSVALKGEKRLHTNLYLQKNPNFESIVTDKFEIVTNLKDKKVSPTNKAILVDRITHFLDAKLGSYPFDKLLLSEADYRNSPVYGLNQLPDFISPFPNGFELDLEILKTATRKYLVNSLALNPRDDHWLIGAIQIHTLIDYVNTYYPDMKIVGSFSDFWIIEWLHAADLEFNDQYSFLYLNMARTNLHQGLTTPKDSLVKFNKNIASDYYAGQGFQYLADYLGKEILDESIKEFVSTSQLKPVTPEDFKQILDKKTELPIDWFFDEYVGKRSTIDFKIQQVKKRGDSLEVVVANRRENRLPVAIYGLNKDKEIAYKQWIAPIDSTQTVMVPRADVKKLVLNYEAVIPEYNQRNNYKNVNGLFNRPLQFRLFKDVEDPDYNQLFFMPVFQYNLYDGFSLGTKLYNKTLLPKGLHYKVEPQFGLRSKALVGKASISYTHYKNEGNLYFKRFGVSGNTFSYNEGLFYRRVSPYVTFGFRDNKDLRKNKKQFVNLRAVNIFRDEDENDPDQEPNYSVFNTQYVYSDKNLINYYRGVFDYQLAKDFSKLSVQFDYRKLFNNNRQLNLRFYAGTFLFNDTGANNNFFSFALDRPTDYLFDYNYYGRSEDAGLFSQQLIIAEGGFKSKLEPAFANQFITTLNASTNIWKWIYAYGDVGLVKNKGVAVEPVFDTGIRASLVADYFEIFLPLYSSLGWEPGLANYDQRIRFIVTLDIKTLLGLFTREWY